MQNKSYIRAKKAGHLPRFFILILDLSKNPFYSR